MATICKSYNIEPPKTIIELPISSFEEVINKLKNRADKAEGANANN